MVSANETVGVANTNALLEDVLGTERTFDESGDYVVKEFLLSLKEKSLQLPIIMVYILMVLSLSLYLY